MECIATIYFKRRAVCCKRSKYLKVNSIKLNNVFQIASIKPLLQMWHKVAMQSIMPKMGSVYQGKLACTIKAEMKHLERSYSTLCCSLSDIW